MKLLYVEDNSRDIDLLKRHLNRQDPQIGLDIATSLSEARSKLSPHSDYDLVLIDLQLPDGTGIEFLGEIRSQALPVAVVMLTGSGNEDVAVAALKAGAEDYIKKSGDYLERIARDLKTALKRHHNESSRNKSRLQVLYVEHNAADIDLTRRHLARYAPNIQVTAIHTAEEALQRLVPGNGEHQDYDLLLLDYRLPGLNALELLKTLRQDYEMDLPVVLITGQGDEDSAAQALRLGANDYLSKQDGYLFQLPVAMENAYHRVQLVREHEALQESEERFRRLTENAQDLIYRFTLKPERYFEYMSPAAYEITGYRPEEYYADSELIAKIVHPDDRSKLESLTEGSVKFKEPQIFRWIKKNGTIVWIEQRNVPVYDRKGNLVALEGIARDITEQKKAEEKIKQNYLIFRQAMEGVVQAMGLAIEQKDPYTAGHQHRVAALAKEIAKQMGMDEDRCLGLQMAAEIHDVGKMSIPAEILNKPGLLSDLEFAIIKNHSQGGYEIINKVDFPWPIAEIVLQHHERLDGSGYPQGLKSDEISLEAKIISVADVVEAMSSHRPYRPALGLEKALDEVVKHKGTLYDPEAVNICVKLFTEKGFTFD